MNVQLFHLRHSRARGNPFYGCNLDPRVRGDDEVTEYPSKNIPLRISL
ncbi:hypothetical protein CPter91_4645 [Collimonas pratensis]|uniref:Uncharacterized protein n=1 Tax=Collimonas pratensis TaxID=279113 RepID=A0A127QA99_9BURK|nr:hypothetical protein CPter91_4645 [Collimonas pratensis]